MNWIQKAAAKLFNISSSYELDRYLRGEEGISINALKALQTSAVYACVRVASEDVAKLPLIVYRRLSNGGKERFPKHPLYKLFHSKPNSFQTSFEFRELLQNHLELRGNFYAYKVMVRGELRELVPINPDFVRVQIEPNYLVKYFVTIDGKEIEHKSKDILHIKSMSPDGFIGYSPIKLHAQSISLSLSTEEHGLALFRNGATPGVVLEHPNKLDNDVKKNLADSWGRFTGSGAHSTVVLDSGLKATKLAMTNEDAQFLETRKYQVNDIARIYRMPPHKIGDLEKATFSNIEHQSREYVIDSLVPRLTRIEQRLNLEFFDGGDEFFIEHNVDALLRGDSAARASFYGAGIKDGWLNRNEARISENKNPEEGLDEFLVPLNMGKQNENKQPVE